MYVYMSSNSQQQQSAQNYSKRKLQRKNYWEQSEEVICLDIHLQNQLIKPSTIYQHAQQQIIQC